MNDFSNGGPPEEERSAQRPPRNLAWERLQIAAPALAIASVILLTSILQSLLHGIVAAYFPDVIKAGWYRQVLSMLPMYLFAMPFSLVLFRLSEAEPPQKRKLKTAVLLGLLAVCFALSYIGNWVGALVNELTSLITGTPAENALVQMTMSTPLWSNLLFIGILAPIMEEIFYRKLVIDRLRRYGELPAILISGIAFGLIHGNFSQFFYAVMIGIVLGYVYLRTGNILHTICLHMAINLICGVFATEVYRHLDMELMLRDPVAFLTQNSVGAVMYVIYMSFLMIACVAGIVSAILLMVYWVRKPTRAAHPLTGGEWVRVLVVNPGVWLFLLVIAMLFLF